MAKAGAKTRPDGRTDGDVRVVTADAAVSRAALPSDVLPILPLDHPVAVPCFDQLRLCVPGLDIHRFSRSPIVELSEALGLPLMPLRDDVPAFHTAAGIFVFVEKSQTRIEFNGRFWALLGYDEQVGLKIVRDIAQSFARQFRRKSHVTRADAMREFPGNDLNAHNILPLPAPRVFWTFLGDKVTPKNQWDGIFVAGPRGAWLVRIYSKRKWLARKCREPDVYAAHVARWEAAGIDAGTDVTRLEVVVKGKQPLRRLTEALYNETLSSAMVFEHWTQRRSIRECPEDANPDVSEKTKTNVWEVSPRFAAAMLMDGAPRRAEKTALPRLTLHEPKSNYRNRALASTGAAVKRLMSWSEHRDRQFDLWDEAIRRRARELVAREASTAVLGFGFRAKGATKLRRGQVLAEGTSILYAKLRGFGERTIAAKVVESVRALHAAPRDGDLQERLYEVLADAIKLTLDNEEVAYCERIEREEAAAERRRPLFAHMSALRSRLAEVDSPISTEIPAGEITRSADAAPADGRDPIRRPTGTKRDGYKDHARGRPPAAAPRLRRSTSASGRRPPRNRGPPVFDDQGSL